MYTKQDCKRSAYDELGVGKTGNVGEIGIINPKWLKNPCPEDQLFLITGGFGAHPEKSGNAVFGKFVSENIENANTVRIEKYMLIGIAKNSIKNKILNKKNPS